MDSIPTMFIDIIYDYFLDLCLLEHRDKFVKVMNELELLYSNTINPDSRRVRLRVLGDYSVDITQFEIPHSRQRRTPIPRRIQFRNKKHMRQYMNNLRFVKNILL